MGWKKDLDALVEETLAFVKITKAEPFLIPDGGHGATKVPEGPSAESAASTAKSSMQDPQPSFSTLPKPLATNGTDDDRPISTLPAGVTEREAILQRVEKYRARQHCLADERQAFYEQQVASIRSMLKRTPDSG
jgi:hypothetical protein